MGKVAVVTDSNSGITQEEGKKTRHTHTADAVLYQRRAVL